MEQKLKKSGFNWQKYYKNVKKGSNHTRANIYCIIYNNADVMNLLELAKKNENVTWIVDSSKNTEDWTLMTPIANMLFINWDRLPEAEKTDFWSKVDYIMNNTNNDELDLILPAMLSGVEVITKKDISEILQKDFSMDNPMLRRIEAFEKGKALLDKLLIVS